MSSTAPVVRTFEWSPPAADDALSSLRADEVLAGDDPLHGEAMTINMGPQHPATHGVLRLVITLDGETIRAVEPVVGYLHRGKEKTCESLGWAKFFPHTDRLDYVQPLMNNVGYALALEKLAGIQVPERGQVIRVLLMELSRVAAHLIYLGTTAIDLGAVTMFFHTFKERERIYSFLDAYTGHRMNNTYVRIGGVYADVDERVEAELRRFLEQFPARVDEFEAMLTRNSIWHDRNRGVGVLTREQALAWSLTGPNLRGSGVELDLRKAAPYSGYEGYEFDVPVGAAGDAYDRYLVRVEEMRQSLRIVEQALAKLPKGPVIVDDRKIALPPKSEVYSNIESLMNHFKLVYDGILPPAGEVYGYNEGANGEQAFYIVSDGRKFPWRVKCRPPCFAVYQAFPEMIKGMLLADAVATIGGLNVIAGELDR